MVYSFFAGSFYSSFVKAAKNNPDPCTKIQYRQPKCFEAGSDYNNIFSLVRKMTFNDM